MNKKLIEEMISDYENMLSIITTRLEKLRLLLNGQNISHNPIQEKFDDRYKKMQIQMDKIRQDALRKVQVSMDKVSRFNMQNDLNPHFNTTDFTKILDFKGKDD